jgi:deoxyribodipyrimidine photolyase-related protein
MIVSLLDSMDPKVRDGHRRRAQALLHPDGGSRLVQPGPGA